jgi:SNF2 family DNA or RNA helicase
MMAKVIQEFTSGTASILLLSAEVKASGANLQVATNVILLDPAGSSAEHGANLETQAIGRAVRMGQEGSVNVVRFCVKDTVEEELFRRIDEAAMTLAMKNNDDTYMCESAVESFYRE